MGALKTTGGVSVRGPQGPVFSVESREGLFEDVTLGVITCRWRRNPAKLWRKSFQIEAAYAKALRWEPAGSSPGTKGSWCGCSIISTGKSVTERS